MTDQQSLHSEASADLSQSNADIWRNEIQARVAGYRTRRGRRIEGAYSMRFPFPPPGQDEAASASVAPETDASNGEQFADAATAIVEKTSTTEVANTETCDLEVSVATEPEVSPVEMPAPSELLAENARPALPEEPVEVDREPLAPSPPRPRPKRKVIAFPRQAVSMREMHHLADPVLLEQPRILDVPEELEALPTTPFLDGLQFGPATQPVAAAHADNVELPFRAAGRAHRLYAGVVDCLLVAAATMVFGAVGYKMLPKVTITKPLLMTAATLPILLWAVYQYVLLVYGGGTAGMRIAKIRVSTFKGTAPSRRQRRHRALALFSLRLRSPWDCCGRW